MSVKLLGPWILLFFSNYCFFPFCFISWLITLQLQTLVLGQPFWSWFVSFVFSWAALSECVVQGSVRSECTQIWDLLSCRVLRIQFSDSTGHTHCTFLTSAEATLHIMLSSFSPRIKAAKMKTSSYIPHLVQMYTSNQVLSAAVHSLVPLRCWVLCYAQIL